MSLAICDFDDCDKKCRCCCGPNEGDLHYCEDPCRDLEGDPIFDPETCDCVCDGALEGTKGADPYEGGVDEGIYIYEAGEGQYIFRPTSRHYRPNLYRCSDGGLNGDDALGFDRTTEETPKYLGYLTNGPNIIQAPAVAIKILVKKLKVEKRCPLPGEGLIITDVTDYYYRAWGLTPDWWGGQPNEWTLRSLGRGTDGLNNREGYYEGPSGPLELEYLLDFWIEFEGYPLTPSCTPDSVNAIGQ